NNRELLLFGEETEESSSCCASLGCHLQHLLKMLCITWYSKDALLPVAKLLSCQLQQAHKAWMVEGLHAHHEPLQLLPCAHHHRNMPFRRSIYSAFLGWLPH
ncbi:unnamed protein product, partial [Musa banksii]